MNASYKKTEIGEIPEEWEIKQLRDLCENLDHMRKPITKSKRVKGKVPYYGAMGVQDYVEGYIFDEDLVLVAEDCGDYKSFGQTAYTISGKAWVNNHAHILRCKKIDWVFLKETLNFLDISRFINTGNRQKLNKSVLERLPIPLPSEVEQKKIASVLSTVDAAIEKTSEIIEQAKQVKKGLMQELLTRGIGHKKFKQTEIGEIPEEWEVAKLGDLCNIQVGKTPSRKIKEYWDKKKTTRNKWTSIADMLGNKIIKDTNEYITDKAIADTRIKRVSAGTLLMSFKLTVGRMAFAGVDLFTNEAIAALAPRDSNSISTDYLYYAIEQARPESYCDPAVKGKTLNQPKIKYILLPLPPLPEQKKIAEILGTADAKIEAEVQKREQLQTLKKGLMQDLLTGRVRFPEFVKGANS